MGLIVMSDLFCLDFTVFRISANESDISNLRLVLYSHDQPIRVSFDIEYNAVVAKNARCAIHRLDVLRAPPNDGALL